MEDEFGTHDSSIFKIISKVGSGTYGNVYKGIYKLKGKEKKIIAIKQVKIIENQEGISSTALREISILRELHHPNIIQLIDVVLENNELYLLFEFIDYDLKRFIDENIRNYTQKDIKNIMKQILESLAFCHSKKIMHRDLKPQNILIDKSGTEIKIADFGLARAFSIPIRPYTKEVLTLPYRAPELLLGMPEYSTPVDIWSVGCIFAELFLKRPLFKCDTEIEEIIKIFSVFGTPNDETWPEFSSLPYFSPNFPKFHPQNLKDIIPEMPNSGINLLKSMLNLNPNCRITAKQALQHYYFSEE